MEFSTENDRVKTYWTATITQNVDVLISRERERKRERGGEGVQARHMFRTYSQSLNKTYRKIGCTAVPPMTALFVWSVGITLDRGVYDTNNGGS